MDRHFPVPVGRLKLRESSLDGAHRIAYVRIHLDRVRGLGTFVELEARIDAIGDLESAGDRMERLVDELGIDPDDDVNGSYGEMP